MHQHHESGTITSLRPFQHLGIARLQIGSSGVAEGSLRSLADEEIDPDGLAGAIVNEKRLWLPHEHRLVAFILVCGQDAGTHDLFRRNAIYLLAVDAHKL